MGGAAALQTFESGERVPGRRLGAGRALAPSSLARVAPRPAGTGDKPSSEFPRPEQGLRVASPAPRAPDSPPAASGAPE